MYKNVNIIYHKQNPFILKSTRDSTDVTNINPKLKSSKKQRFPIE